jgi:hypothetical protein
MTLAGLIKPAVQPFVEIMSVTAIDDATEYMEINHYSLPQPNDLISLYDPVQLLVMYIKHFLNSPQVS